MKKWIVMIVISALLVVGCIFESRFINSSIDELSSNLKILQTKLDDSKDKIDYEEFVSLSENIHENWHNKLSGLKCLIWHSWVKDAEVGMARITVYISENDYTEASAEIASLQDYLAHYKSDFEFSIENIL